MRMFVFPYVFVCLCVKYSEKGWVVFYWAQSHLAIIFLWLDNGSLDLKPPFSPLTGIRAQVSNWVVSNWVSITVIDLPVSRSAPAASYHFRFFFRIFFCRGFIFSFHVTSFLFIQVYYVNNNYNEIFIFDFLHWFKWLYLMTRYLGGPAEYSYFSLVKQIPTEYRE